MVEHSRATLEKQQPRLTHRTAPIPLFGFQKSHSRCFIMPPASQPTPSICLAFPSYPTGIIIIIIIIIIMTPLQYWQKQYPDPTPHHTKPLSPNESYNSLFILHPVPPHLAPPASLFPLAL